MQRLETSAAKEDTSAQDASHQKAPQNPEHETASTSTPTPFFFQLPLEVLGNLLDKYVPHEAKLTLRQVHPLFQILFDHYLGFKVTLDNDDNELKFNFVSNLAIRKATIQNLTCAKTFQQLVLYPHFLQEVFVKGSIDAELFSEIVRKCNILRTLELCPGSNVKSSRGRKDENNTDADVNDNTAAKADTRYVLPEIDVFSTAPQDERYLPKCRFLKLLLNQDLSETPSDINCEAVLASMKSIRSPVLERAVIQGWISERFSVSRITLMAASFLERNPKIESFFLGVIYEHLIDNDAPITQEDIQLRPLIQEKLKDAGELLNIQKFGISTQSFDMVLWKEFIKRQTSLHHASFTVDLTEGVFSADIFRSCRNTLSQLILRGKFLTTFDFSWVEECNQLKEICLHNIDHNDQPSATTLHAVNISSVPKNLESLVLFQTILRTDDIVAALRKLKLHTLVLFKTGNTGGETGINVECLKLIFRCRSLQSVLLVRFVAPNPVEAAELVKILQTMNDGQIHREVAVTDDVNIIEDGEDAVEDSGDEDAPSLVEISQSQMADLGLDFIICGNDEDDTAVENDGKGSQESEACDEEASSSKLESDCDNLPKPENASVSDRYSKPPNVGITEENLTSEIKKSTGFKFNKPGRRNRHNSGDQQERPSSCTNSTDEKNTPDLKNFPQNASEAGQLVEPNLLPDLEHVEEKIHQKPANNNNNNTNEGNVQSQDEGFKNISTTPQEAAQPPHEDAELDENANNTEALENSDFPLVIEVESETSEDNDDAWADVDSDEFSDDSGLDEDEDIFDIDLDDINLDVLEQVAEAQAAAGAANVQLILNLQNENDLEEMLGLLDPIDNANANLNNIQFGFILDGVIDIQGVDAKRSRWIAVEDEEGHLTYTLKISID